MAAITVKRSAAWLCSAAISLGATAQDAGIERLERLFWACDYAATQGALDGASAMNCSVATEALKAAKFGGDFGAMLAWWRERKTAEHLALGGVEDAKRLAAQRR